MGTIKSGIPRQLAYSSGRVSHLGLFNLYPGRSQLHHVAGTFIEATDWLCEVDTRVLRVVHNRTFSSIGLSVLCEKSKKLVQKLYEQGAVRVHVEQRSRPETNIADVLYIKVTLPLPDHLRELIQFLDPKHFEWVLPDVIRLEWDPDPEEVFRRCFSPGQIL